jgi:hypothetical protein
VTFITAVNTMVTLGLVVPEIGAKSVAGAAQSRLVPAAPEVVAITTVALVEVKSAEAFNYLYTAVHLADVAKPLDVASIPFVARAPSAATIFPTT